LLSRDHDLLVLREDMIDWVNIGNRVLLHYEEAIPETDIITRRLEARLIET
jgi:hypothetical protein